MILFDKNIVINSELRYQLHHFSITSYHERVAAGLKRGQTDTKNDNGGKGIVIDKSAAMSISMATI